VEKVLKFFHLTSREKLAFCRAVYLLLYYRIALRRQHFQTMVDSLLHAGSSTFQQTGEPISVDVLVRLLAVACRVVPFTTCLSRAMAGQRLLTSYGHASVFHIGVAREKDLDLEAHAWLSLDGNLILGNIPDLERYRELPPLQAGWSERR